jgi:hypothetical protein
MDWKDFFDYEGKIWPEKNEKEIPNEPDGFTTYAESWSEILNTLNELAREDTDEQGMPYCEVYHEVLIYDAYWDTDLEMAIFYKVCANCDTQDKEVIL